MKWCSDDQLKWLKFGIFGEHPELVAGCYTRHGGVSAPPYDSLNLGDGLGDSEEAVTENRRRVMAHLGVERQVGAEQVHGTHVHTIGDGPVPPCDGLILTQPGVGAMIKHADCQAAILYDPTQKVVAVIHAGWRGLVQNIYANAVAQLPSKPENLLVAISPSLGPEAAEFTNYRHELPEPFWDFQTKVCHFDLWAIAEHQLFSLGILPHHLEITRHCTFADPTNFFSYRRNNNTGRNATAISLNFSLV